MDYEVKQASTILNAIVAQQTGQTAIATISSLDDFVSVAETALKTGYDPIINAISQVWRDTVFAVRDYDIPLSTLRMTAQRYGNATRKLSPEAMPMEDDEAYLYPAGYDSSQTDPFGTDLSVDHYKLNKQRSLETHFYGSLTYQQRYSIFRDALEVSFSSPSEMLRFHQMNIAERINDRRSYEEAKARLLQLNLIGGIISENNASRNIKLLTEYNAATGLSLTATTVMQPANFVSFIRWMYARIKTLVGLMAHRSEEFQTVITGHTILRHTDAQNVRIALYRPFMEMINSMVLSGLYNNDLMTMPTYEAVDFWQDIKTPQTINVTPVYTNSSGVATVAGAAVNKSTVIGVIHDKDALGYAWINPTTAVTPLNAAGLYFNEYYHAKFATLSDNTEKCIVLLLE